MRAAAPVVQGDVQYGEHRRAFVAHGGAFVLGTTVMFAVNLVTNLAAGVVGSWSAWWSLWALVGWGAGLATHGFVVWLNRPAQSERSES